MPVSRSAPVKVVVFQWPCGTPARQRSPRGARPRSRAILVDRPVSSMKTSFARSSWPSNHSRRRFIGVRVLARGIRRDDGLCSSLGEPIPQTCSIIGAVGQQLVAGAADDEQRFGAGEIMSIAGRQGEGDGPAAIVAQRMDFRRSPAARGANGVMTSPPFAPAAERWALMWVESTEPVNTPVDPVRA